MHESKTDRVVLGCTTPRHLHHFLLQRQPRHQVRHALVQWQRSVLKWERGHCHGIVIVVVVVVVFSIVGV